MIQFIHIENNLTFNYDQPLNVLFVQFLIYQGNVSMMMFDIKIILIINYDLKSLLLNYIMRIHKYDI